MSKRKNARLFAYRLPHTASRTLKALNRAFPDHAFALVPGSGVYSFRYVIRATLPSGESAPVCKAPLSSFARNTAQQGVEL